MPFGFRRPPVFERITRPVGRNTGYRFTRVILPAQTDAVWNSDGMAIECLGNIETLLSG